jgi:filamentous hemagglutinin family protein
MSKSNSFMKTNFFFLPIIFLVSIINGKIAQAQTYQPSNRFPVADNTLGTTILRNADNFAINGGLSRGQNTFHSFQDFSVPTNGVATFANPVGNQSIITRVTGNLFSDINGTINTQGANFLLINPNGVVFGPGTQLNVGRVFAASTANSLDLADGTGKTLTFGVNGAGDGALLSIDPKVVFNVSRLNLGGGNGEINNFGTLETNNPGQYIGLVGGNVNLNNGEIFSQQGGRIELGGLSAPGSVGLGVEGNNLKLSFPANTARANVSIDNQSTVNTFGDAGGNIAITAKNIDILGSSFVANGILSGTGAAGDIKLDATENITLGSNSFVGSSIGLSGIGGSIFANADSLAILDGSGIGTFTSGKGNAGDTTVTANNNVFISGGASIFSQVSNGAEGNGGNIVINTGNLLLQDEARVSALTNGKGNGGDVTIRAKDSTVALTDSRILSTVRADGVGKGGNVAVITDSLAVQDGAGIGTFTNGKGNAGNTTIAANSTVAISGSGASIFSEVGNRGEGNGGNIVINTNNLSLKDRAEVYAFTNGKGTGGDVTIKAKDSTITDSSILSDVGVNGVGKSGDISLNSENIFLDNALVANRTAGKGNTGNILLTAKDTISAVGNTLVTSLVQTDAVGNSGSITIDTSNLSLKERSNVSALTEGKGNSGDLNIKAKDSAIIDSFILNGVGINGIGKGGDIRIDAGGILLSNTLVETRTLGEGSAGNIFLTAQDTISVAKSTRVSSQVQTSGVGNSGDIKVKAASLSVSDSSFFNETAGKGNGGGIDIFSDGHVSFSNSRFFNTVDNEAVGNGGNTIIQAGSLKLDSNSSLFTSTSGNGNTGNIEIFSGGNVSFSNSNIFNAVRAGAVGSSGDITIRSDSLTLDNSSGLSNRTDGQGRTGDITVMAQGAISLANKSIFINNVGELGVGKTGDINVTSNSLLVNDGTILTFVSGRGNAGNTNITVKDAISLSAQSTISNNLATVGIGKSGDVNISSGSLSSDSSTISSSTFGSGNAGNVSLTVRDDISFLNTQIFSNVANNVVGNSGGININTGKLLGDSSAISSSTFGLGNAGNVSLAVRDDISFSNTRVFSDVSAGGVGKGGNIDVTAGSLTLTNGSNLISIVRPALGTQPAGRGDAGDITVKVAGAANFDTSNANGFSGLFSNTEPGTVGNGGNISITAKTISLREGAGFRSTIAGTGNSGNVTVNATDQLSFDGSAGVLTRVEATGIGNGGNITVSGSDISFKNGAGLSAETLGSGKAGTIVVDSTNSIFLSGEGNNTRSLFVVDRGGIFTRSQSATGSAGDITVTAPKITLDNGGIISAQSDFGGGGNITIGSKNATDLLFLRRGSQIATDAGVTAQQGGDGGNININANFIFAAPKENSDISANAARGRGGNVNVNSQGLFGIQLRSQPSSSSDITASSSFGQNGTVNINTPGIDPGKDTSELPSAPTDASRQITQTCNSSQLDNKFHVTGRGGHPATSEDHLGQEVVWLDPRNPRTQVANNSITQSVKKTPQPTVGWAFDGKGKVTLLAASNEKERYGANVTCSHQANLPR